MLWSLINTQFMLLYFQMLQHVKFPANVNTVNQVFVALKDFEFLKIGDILNDALYNFPNEGPISLGAQSCGIESSFAAENLGTAHWLGYLFLLLIILRYFNVCGPYTKRLLSSARWNGPITFFMETYFDFVMFVMINLKYVKQETDYHSVEYSNVLTIILLVLTILMSILIPVFYWYKRKSWSDPTFQKKYGSLIEGYIINEESKWPVLAMMVLFMVRRVLFVFAVL